jgi:poly-beta-1,6-N-acetyl-D-glucosamine synthase
MDTTAATVSRGKTLVVEGDSAVALAASGSRGGGTGGSITVLIPAHNEEGQIADAIAGLRAQTRAVDKIIVVSDNCTDATEQIAARAGAEVFRTRGNSDKKAGALNQALREFLRGADDDDLVLVQDADTVLVPRFVEVGRQRLTPAAGAVGGVFYGARGGGVLGFFQRSEFARYAREIDRKDQVAVLSGTAALFRAATLRHVVRARAAGTLPGGTGVYDPNAFTEDNELTLALKTLGYHPVSPGECRVVTEVMPTLPKLWKQRVRWQRGALENLRTYGWTRTTRPYILRQIAMAASVISLALYVAYTMACWALAGHVAVSVPWMIIGLLFAAERVVTVRRAGPAAMLVAGPLLIEFAYDLFQHAVYVSCVAGALRNGKQHWAAT